MPFFSLSSLLLPLVSFIVHSTSSFDVSNDEESTDYESSWTTQPDRVDAFSLYGILKGHGDSGCTKENFINSYVAWFCAESFIEAMKLKGHLSWSINYNDDYYFANSDFSSICQGDLGSDHNNQAYNDDAHVPNMGETMYRNATTMALGCSAYQTSLLQTSEGVVDTLDTQNIMLNSMGCVNLYDDAADYPSDQYNSDVDVWDFPDFWDDKTMGKIVPRLSSGLDLLEHGRACAAFFFRETCPDPHGLYQEAYQEALNQVRRRHVVDDGYVAMIRRYFVALLWFVDFFLGYFVGDFLPLALGFSFFLVVFAIVLERRFGRRWRVQDHRLHRPIDQGGHVR